MSQFSRVTPSARAPLAYSFTHPFWHRYTSAHTWTGLTLPYLVFIAHGSSCLLQFCFVLRPSTYTFFPLFVFSFFLLFFSFFFLFLSFFRNFSLGRLVIYMPDLYIFIPYGYSFHSPHPSGSGRVADVGVWLRIFFVLLPYIFVM